MPGKNIFGEVSEESADSRGGIEVDPVPAGAVAALEQEAEKAGGVHAVPAELEGSVGRTMFDLPSSNDGTITVLLPREEIDLVPSQSMLRIKSSDDRAYIGVVTAGPFAEPDGLRGDADPLVMSNLNHGVYLPNYHGRVQVELLGEETTEGLTTPRHRPKPNSPVFLVDDSEMTELLGSCGDVRIGVATGHPDVKVCIPSEKKSVLPRHLGVLGTTGGGKTTTVSNMIAELQKADAAVILLDTEGEYTTIHQPCDDEPMMAARHSRGLGIGGVQRTTIYHLVGRETANPTHPSLQQFGLQFSTLSPWALKEILGLSDAQEQRFMEAYDVTKLVLRKTGIFPSQGSQRDEIAALEVDELVAGWPHMTLQHLLYVASAMTNKAAGKDEEPWQTPDEFEDHWESIKRLVAQSQPKNQISWRALMARLHRLNRLRIFDQASAGEPDYSRMLDPGSVTIVDLSDLDSPTIRNLAIAQILQGIQRQQDLNYERASQDDGSGLSLAMVLIEEAHEFLSAERIRQMPILFQQVARIARRGRKRWLGLGFITQLPQHLPDEVLALINNWVLHKIQDTNVINRLRRVVPGVGDAMWRGLPAQPPGQAVVSFTHLARPVAVSMDASPCRLLMVD